MVLLHFPLVYVVLSTITLPRLSAQHNAMFGHTSLVSYDEGKHKAFGKLAILIFKRSNPSFKSVQELETEIAEAMADVKTSVPNFKTSVPSEPAKDLQTKLADLMAEEGAKEVGTAATIMLALAFANGLYTLEAQDNLRDNRATGFDFLNKRLADEDANVIASVLTEDVLPKIDKPLSIQYNRRIRAGMNPVQATRASMEAVSAQHNFVHYYGTNVSPSLGCEFDDNEYSFSKDRKWATVARPHNMRW